MMTMPDPMFGYDMRDHGLDLTGATDSGDDINALINSAPAGSVIKIPNGSVRIGTTLALNKQGMQLIGQSMRGVEFNGQTGSGATAAMTADECVLWGHYLIHGSTTSGIRYTITNASRCLIRKLYARFGSQLMLWRPSSGVCELNMLFCSFHSQSAGPGAVIGATADTGHCRYNTIFFSHVFRSGSTAGGGTDWVKGSRGNLIGGDSETFQYNHAVRAGFTLLMDLGGFCEQSVTREFQGEAGGSAIIVGNPEWNDGLDTTKYRELSA